ncbi:hypothetical protein PHYPO_G00028930 [Pangasianodon hypophthalmus]|uniref:Uncharacterized protein n=1 Tax=Pangasianodon hypophthalmus TaxID=310915 RepID=A0A5N5MWA5_PANHP|nr:hypothetical protein PHYPO_G00028930 [Pangasianodon hypophthalmus]
MFQFISKVFSGVEVRALCRTLEFFHSKLVRPCLHRARFAHRHTVMLKQERTFPKCSCKFGSIQLSKMSLYAVALRLPFTGTTGPKSFKKNSSRPLSLCHQTSLLALCVSGRWCSSGIHQTQIHPSDCQIAKRDSSLQGTCFHCSRIQQCCFTPLQLTLDIVHSDLRLGCSCSAMETHFMKLLIHSSCVDVASRGSLELCSE